MNIADAIGPVVVGLFVFALLLEWRVPREVMPRVRGWHAVGVVFLACNAAINIGLPLLLPTRLIETHSLLPGYHLGLTGGFVVGLVVWELLYYWLHRAEHYFDFLWRALHQMHHSAARVDVSGFAYSHPLDVAVTTASTTLVTVGLLGLQPQASALVGVYVAVASVVQHMNVATPPWLEWLMQRPEAHARHHEYGQHAGNYADWPVMDKLFGTYRAPARQPLRYGFDAAATRRVGAMLAWVDVNKGKGQTHHE